MKKTLMSFLVVAFCAPGFAGAQSQREHNRPGNKRGQWKQNMRKKRAQVLRVRIGLNERRAQRVEALMDDFESKRRPLRRQLRTSFKDIRRLLKSDSQDQRAFSQALSGIDKAKRSLKAMQEAQLVEIRKLLTPKEQAQLMMAHRQMRRGMMRRKFKRMQRRRGRAHQQRRGPRGPNEGGFKRQQRRPQLNEYEAPEPPTAQYDDPS